MMRVDSSSDAGVVAAAVVRGAALSSAAGVFAVEFSDAASPAETADFSVEGELSWAEAPELADWLAGTFCAHGRLSHNQQTAERILRNSAS